MTIDELKRALVEVHDICSEHITCRRPDTCPFWLASIQNCALHLPDCWDIDEWKGDSE